MATNDVIVALRAAGQAAFESAMESSAKSIGKVDAAAGGAEKSVTKAGDSATKSSKGWKSGALSLAKWAGGAAAVYKGAQFLKGSMTATTDLAKATMALSRSTGLSTESSSAWAEVLKVRGINTKQFQTGMVKLSKQMQKGASDTKAYGKTFEALGISQDTLKAGDINSVIMQSADALSKMTNPAQKAAVAQDLFGKSGQALLPILGKGSEGVQEQLDMVEKYGATLSGKSVKSVGDMIAKQREMTFAMDGFKLQLGQALLPVLTSIVGVFSQLATIMAPFTQNATLMTAAIALLTTAFIAYKVAMVVATLSTLTFNAAFLLIPIAVVAVVAALVLAYQKVGWFRNAVNAMWSAIKTGFNWLKANWKTVAMILTGPFGIAVGLIAKNWDKIKSGASSVLKWFRDFGSKLIHGVVDGIKSAPGAILDALKSMLPGGKAGALIRKAIPGFAMGGVMPHTGYSVVGERGPELVQLPGGSRITPLPAPSLASPSIDGARAFSSQTTAHFYMDRRLVATAVADDTADQKARR